MLSSNHKLILASLAVLLVLTLSAGIVIANATDKPLVQINVFSDLPFNIASPGSSHNTVTGTTITPEYNTHTM